MIDPLLRAFAVDPKAFRVLHRAFWTLSRREPSGLVMARDATKAPKVGRGLWVYLLFGGFASFTAALGGPRDLYATSILGMTLLMTSLAVVADFAAVVIAPGDDEILFHLPLSSRTYLAARLAVAARHTALIALAFAVLPALVGALTWKSAAFGLALLASAVWTGWFALVLAFLVYRVALRALGAERLRTLLAYVPGIASLALAFGPQALTSVRPVAGGAAAWAEGLDRVAPFFPPAWFSGLVEAMCLDFTGRMPLRAAIGLAVVPLSAWLLVAALGRGFLDDLLRLVSGKDAGPTRATGAAKRTAPSRLATRAFGLGSCESRAGWLLYVGAMRSRASRARLFPLLAMPFLIVALNLFRAGSLGWGSGAMILVGLYLVAASGASLVAFLPYHESREAGWLLPAAPLARYGRFHLGVLRAMLVHHVLPSFLAMSAIAIAAAPTLATAGGVAHAASTALLSIALAVWGLPHRLPFSSAFQAGEQGGRNLGIALLNFLLVAVLGGIHAAVAHFFPWAFLVTVPATATIAVLWLSSTAARLDRFPPQALRAAAS